MTVDNSSTTVDTHLANSGLNIFGQPLSPSGSHPASPVSQTMACSIAPVVNLYMVGFMFFFSL